MAYPHFTIAYWCVFVAAMLPLACAALVWLAKQAEWAPRAGAAKSSSFEALPFFIGAVIIAQQLGAAQGVVDILAIVFVTLRIVYIAMYVAGLPMVRSAIWSVALLVNIGIFFAGFR